MSTKLEKLLEAPTVNDDDLAIIIIAHNNAIDALRGFGARYQMVVDDLITRRQVFVHFAENRKWTSPINGIK